MSTRIASTLSFAAGVTTNVGEIYMDIYSITKIILFFILVASSETLNGIARTVYLNKRVGIRKAKRISMVSALILCLLICYWYIPMLNIRTDKGLLLLGISLSSFMVMFDIVLGRFVVKAKWKTIMEDFNLAKGNLLALGIIVMALCPLLASRIPHIP
jgi:hypothetical protein